MDTGSTMLVSLAVATLMQSQVITGVFRDEDTNDASSSSMIVQDAGGSPQQKPEGLNGGEVAESPEDAMSSGSASCLGLWPGQKGGGRLYRQLCVVCQGCAQYGSCSAGFSP